MSERRRTSTPPEPDASFGVQGRDVTTCDTGKKKSVALDSAGAPTWQVSDAAASETVENELLALWIGMYSIMTLLCLVQYSAAHRDTTFQPGRVPDCPCTGASSLRASIVHSSVVQHAIKDAL